MIMWEPEVVNVEERKNKASIFSRWDFGGKARVLQRMKRIGKARTETEHGDCFCVALCRAFPARFSATPRPAVSTWTIRQQREGGNEGRNWEEHK